MNKQYIILFILVSSFLLFPVLAEAQCSMCSAVVSSNLDQEAAKGRGINKAILFLMAFPYLLGMGFIYAFYRERIKLFFQNKFRS